MTRLTDNIQTLRHTLSLRLLRPCLILLALLAAPLHAEVTLPELGDSASSALSKLSERKLGEQAMLELRQAGAVLSDPEINTYLNKLGDQLLKASNLDPEHYEFFAVPAWDINAFALPGGYIGINLGLIEIAQSESELASVLAHEIAHVTQRHLARQMEAQKKQSTAVLAGFVAAIAAAAAGNGELATAALSTTLAGQMQSQLNYSRDNEHEADRIGFTLLHDAAYDTRAMASFFGRLQAATSHGSDAEQYSYLQTHPLTRDRIAEVQDRATRNPTTTAILPSTDFALINALIRSYHGESSYAQAQLKSDLNKSQGLEAQANRYGLAAALLRSNDYKAANTTLAPLLNDIDHPMVTALEAYIALQMHDNDRAVSLYEKALLRYPDHAQLIFDYPQALIAAGQLRAAATYTQSELNKEPSQSNAAKLHQIAAEAWAGLMQQSRSHLHLAEHHALMGHYTQAIEQFELAYDINDAGPLKRKVITHRLKQVKTERTRSLRTNKQDNGSYTPSLSHFKSPKPPVLF